MAAVFVGVPAFSGALSDHETAVERTCPCLFGVVGFCTKGLVVGHSNAISETKVVRAARKPAGDWAPSPCVHEPLQLSEQTEPPEQDAPGDRPIEF